MYIIRANIRIYPIMHIIRPNIHVPKQSKGSKICKETSPLTRRWTRLTSRMQIYRSFSNFPSFFHSSLMSRWFSPTGRYTFMCYLSLYIWTLILCCLKNTRSAKSASVQRFKCLYNDLVNGCILDVLLVDWDTWSDEDIHVAYCNTFLLLSLVIVPLLNVIWEDKAMHALYVVQQL